MRGEKSEFVVVPQKSGNSDGGKDERKPTGQTRERLPICQDGEEVYTKLERLEAVAQRDKKVKFTSLAHLLTVRFLANAYRSLNQKGAPGVDGITMEEYGQSLPDNVKALYDDLVHSRYKADNVRRTYIPKGNGKERALGIPSVKDRVVQRAVGILLNTIYEPYFRDFSYGYRAGRSAHGALETLKKNIDRNKTQWVVEVDIKGYFDNVNHRWMLKFLEHRIADTTILRLIAKWMKAGIMDQGVVTKNEQGTPQGGPISPILANIYLHYVLDLWFDFGFKQHCRGQASMVRFADDFVACFERKEDAERFLSELKTRLENFDLEVSEEKTTMMEFGKRASTNGRKGPCPVQKTFEFLGFTHYMRKAGYSFSTARKPSRKKIKRFLDKVKEWVNDHKHWNIYWQLKTLTRKLRGFYNYFALRHCLPSLRKVRWHVKTLWVKALRRRGQKHKLNWCKIERYPWLMSLPVPTRVKRV